MATSMAAATFKLTRAATVLSLRCYHAAACKHKIPKGALRLCVNQSLETSEMQQKDYRHLALACLDPATLRGVVRHTFDLDRLVAALQARGQGGPADQAKARSVMERALKTVPVPASVAQGAAARRAAAAGAPAAEGAGTAAAAAEEESGAAGGGAAKKAAGGAKSPAAKKAAPAKKPAQAQAGPTEAQIGPKTPAEARQTRAGTKRKAAELQG
ncbi:hypothetical protein HYH03_005804 [Edaphochlamys debaryana]|uniref:Uncharacterized protein n=1 Tax=Edaphochlamys debaryana TaxID=47281 RepID=A0A835YC85_9CHLO|nr:hypothetical protein HYH03_005804 [Edaphochlamys debaryana]|eukprot:KAG2496205.1 hypothetical protein HYH03_005804 [Edaphochlamys debaryana]